MTDRYDIFWTTLLILVGTVLAFYLVGVLLSVVGVWLQARKKARWVCPVCEGKMAFAPA